MGTGTLSGRQAALAREGPAPDQARQRPGLGGGPPDGGGTGGGREWGGAGAEAAFSPAVTGAWMLTAAVAMLFVGFTSTYLVRRTAPDWQAGPMPPLLNLNTALIAASSVALEWGRARGRREQLQGLLTGLGWACILGAAFLTGQAVAWWQLLGGGVTPAGRPHSSFFYLLTGIHGLHVAGGLGWLVRAWIRSRRASAVAQVRATVAASAVFWHFIGVLWLYLWVLLFWI